MHRGRRVTLKERLHRGRRVTAKDMLQLGTCTFVTLCVKSVTKVHVPNVTCLSLVVTKNVKKDIGLSQLM